MKHLILAAAAALALTACATSGPSAYGPSYGNDTGFKNTKIQQDRFRVSYTGRSEDEAQNFALLRAAEIALAEGYTHFKVLGGNVSSNGGSAPVSSRIGVGIGNGGFGRTRTNVNLGVGVHDVARALEGTKVTESIEIILKNGPGANDPSIFDAQGVKDNIRPPVFKN